MFLMTISVTEELKIGKIFRVYVFSMDMYMIRHRAC